MRRRIAIVVMLLAVLGGGWYFGRDYLTPHRDDARLLLLGNVDVRQVDLAFKVDGRIATMTVDEGDAVVPGQLLASLDKSYFVNDLAVAKARRAAQAANVAKLEHGSRPEEIAQAQATVALYRSTTELNQLTFQRQAQLVREGNTSRQSYDNAAAALRQAEAQLNVGEQTKRLVETGPRQEDIDAARAQLALEDGNITIAERRLQDGDLVAPGAGVILTRAHEPGAIVSPGTTVYALTITSPVWVRAYVGEPDLGRIRPGMRADVTTDSAPGKIYRGTIGFISPVAEFTPKSVETRELRTDLVYRLRIVVENPDAGLRQGMPVTVRLALGG
ncbi:MAG: secretion protein HlyD [Rhodospirillales bacterium]|nr:secretion protein HlyD [Rhodospirillales bacterium]